MLTLPIHVLVLAKAPVPGRVKTRLVPPYAPAEAAALADAALRDTLAAVAATPVAKRTVVLQGQPGPWMRSEFGILRQRGEGLDERLAAAYQDGWAAEGLPMLLVGMDTPQVSPALLKTVARLLIRDDVDVVLGMADDGGWWTLGLKRPDDRLLLGVPMSTRRTGATQLRRLERHGQRVALAPRLRDVDTV